MSFIKGQQAWNKGQKCPQISIALIGNKNRVGYKDTPAMLAAKKSRSGENSPVWKGGKPKCTVCNKELRYGRKNCILHSKGNTKHGLWKEDNGYKSWLKNKRNRMLRKIEFKHTYLEWIALKELYRNTCPSCKRSEPEVRLTEDHIVPISKGGTDSIANIQPLCRSCNSVKNNKEVRYFL